MSQDLVARLFGELDRLVLIDPHTHINPLSPASSNLADLLGYHYYTELAHSAGLPRERIEAPGLSARDKVAVLVENLQPLENTVQYSWLIELAQKFFGFRDEKLTPKNWESLYDAVEQKGKAPDWADQVLTASGVSAVFLTNDFDDPLTGFDPAKYIPCLRTDDLVFHLGRKSVRDRLAKATDVDVHNTVTLRTAIGRLFEKFVRGGAKACAISLPPDFSPHPVDVVAANEAIYALYHETPAGDVKHTKTASQFAFWTLAEFCTEHKLPFDLMIGVNRAVYPGGVYQGQDLFDRRCSLIQYRELFNAFPATTFPTSVLSTTVNQELVAYSWIFPNVVPNGHWWYSNIPSYIEPDLAARLEAVPQTKTIGYYSDAYKMEFVFPKFAMFKRCLARVLAEKFVVQRKWSESAAVALGHQVLRGNVERIFNVG